MINIVLEDNRKLYESVANINVPNWRTIDKNELIRAAVDCKKSEKDGYVAAIMLRYWSKIDKYYYKCKLVATPEDVHTWLVKAVMYAMDVHPWTDENSSIYNDPKGPDKVINRFIESRRITFYQQLNRYVRKIQSEKLSLDSFIEDYSDAYMPADKDDYEFELDYYITYFFQMKDYLKSFILDILLYQMRGEDIDDVRKVITNVRKIDDEYCHSFSMKYGVPFDRVKKAYSYVERLSYNKLKQKVKYHILDLRYELKQDFRR